MVAGRTKLGVYMSYSEDEWGPFEEAVDISNDQDYLIMGNTSVIKPERFDFPTSIVIRVKGQERYYKGVLDEVKRSSTVSPEQFLSERQHRPRVWQAMTKETYPLMQSVLYIRNLKKVLLPPEIKGKRPPQRPIYVNLESE